MTARHPEHLRITRRMFGILGLATASLTSCALFDQLRSAPGRHSVFLAGDSTAATFTTSDIPLAGWGQALRLFLRPELYQISNHARSGASSRSFLKSGRLTPIMANLRADDLLLVSFGHNDSKPDQRYADPFGAFATNLSQFIDAARGRGATAVLVTPMASLSFDSEGQAVSAQADYARAMREVGSEQKVAVVDLTALSLDLWSRLGPEGGKRYFLVLAPGEHPNYPAGRTDTTHLRARGAIEIARLVTRGLVDAGVVAKAAVIDQPATLSEDTLGWKTPAARLSASSR